MASLTTLAAFAGPLVSGGGVWAWMAARHKAKTEAPALMMGSVAQFQAILNTAAQGIVGDLKGQVIALEGRVRDLEQENDTCRGENRQLRQRVDSLEAFLRRQGIPIPAGGIEGSLVVIEDGCTTVTKATPKGAS